jgi:predicted 2-oxoglutarate/Fe(II)-dependent dioxygenase YbiX
MFYQNVIFNKEECNKIISLIDSISKIDGKNKYGADSKTDVSFDEYRIRDTIENAWFMDKIKTSVEDVLKIKLNLIDNDVHILSYGINDGFSKHIDFNAADKDPRVYTIGVLLNTDYEDGNLIIYENEKIILNKLSGNFYIFKTTIPHEVEKITNGKRYCIILHIKNSEIKKINLF